MEPITQFFFGRGESNFKASFCLACLVTGRLSETLNIFSANTMIFWNNCSDIFMDKSFQYNKAKKDSFLFLYLATIL